MILTAVITWHFNNFIMYDEKDKLRSGLAHSYTINISPLVAHLLVTTRSLPRANHIKK